MKELQSAEKKNKSSQISVAQKSRLIRDTVFVMQLFRITYNIIITRRTNANESRTIFILSLLRQTTSVPIIQVPAWSYKFLIVNVHILLSKYVVPKLDKQICIGISSRYDTYEIVYLNNN